MAEREERAGRIVTYGGAITLVVFGLRSSVISESCICQNISKKRVSKSCTA